MTIVNSYLSFEPTISCGGLFGMELIYVKGVNCLPKNRVRLHPVANATIKALRAFAFSAFGRKGKPSRS